MNNMNSNLMGVGINEDALLGRTDSLSNNDMELNSMRTANANIPGAVG